MWDSHFRFGYPQFDGLSTRLRLARKGSKTYTTAFPVHVVCRVGPLPNAAKVRDLAMQERVSKLH